MTLDQLKNAKYDQEKIKIGDYRVTVERDENSQSSRENDNIATMYCRHNKYTLGDQIIPEDFEVYDDKTGETQLIDIDDQKSFEQWMDELEGEKILAIKPLSLYDHSGLVMSIGNPTDKWDSMQVGWIVVTEKQAKMIGITDLSQDNLEKIMRQEVEIYNQDLSGDIYGYIVEKGKKCDSCEHVEYEEIDSCWGLYDDDSLLEAINQNLED